MEAQEYKKLVEALRCCASGACDSEKCDYMGMGAYGCMIGLAQDAAAAIEALQAEVDALAHDIKRYVQINVELTTEIEALQAYCEQLKTENTMLYNTITADKGAMFERIKYLGQQLPKHGKWIHIEGDDPWEWTCSVCMKKSEIHGEEPAFCPKCGADMRKMEVQE